MISQFKKTENWQERCWQYREFVYFESSDWTPAWWGHCDWAVCWLADLWVGQEVWCQGGCHCSLLVRSVPRSIPPPTLLRPSLDSFDRRSPPGFSVTPNTHTMFASRWTKPVCALVFCDSIVDLLWPGQDSEELCRQSPVYCVTSDPPSVFHEKTDTEKHSRVITKHLKHIWNHAGAHFTSISTLSYGSKSSEYLRSGEIFTLFPVSVQMYIDSYRHTQTKDKKTRFINN